MSTVVYGFIVSTAEMVAAFPYCRGTVGLADRFVDPALGKLGNALICLDLNEYRVRDGLERLVNITRVRCITILTLLLQVSLGYHVTIVRLRF
jgi:hypothetical protein